MCPVTAELILEIAHHALGKAMKQTRAHYKRGGWQDHEVEDAREEAIVHILQAAGKQPENGSYGYLVRAGLLGIWMYLRKLCREKRTFQYIDTWDESLVSSDLYPSVLERLLTSVGGLKKLLREQRSCVTRLTDAEVQHEIDYLRLLLQGYTYEEIAFRMAVTRKATWMMHDRLVERLDRIAKGQKARQRVLPSPSEASLENLRKIQNDPQALARRAQSLRKTINTPEGRERWSAASKKQWARRKQKALKKIA